MIRIQVIVLQDNAITSKLTQLDVMCSNTFLPVLNASKSVCAKTLAKTYIQDRHIQR